MHALIAVPTYWTRPRGELPRADDAVFDHPTPVDGESTLPRLLESLLAADVAFPFDVLVVVGVVTPDLSRQAEWRVRKILAAYGEPVAALDLLTGKVTRRSPRLLYIGPAHIGALQDVLGRAGFPKDALSPYTYPGLRNVHLLIPFLLHYDAVVSLDDDEIVPPDYFHRAQEAVSASGARGIAGLYLDPGGTLSLVEGPREGNIFLEKMNWMHQALRDLLSSGRRWIPTPLALGGNMIFLRALISRAGFDPYITRGEDIDYVLNAAIEGEPFVLDRELHIEHRPPRAYDTHLYAKLAQDVRRFLYEREKVRRVQKSRRGRNSHVMRLVESPYPGRFLSDDVETHALEALRTMADSRAVALWGTPEAIVDEAVKRAHTLAPRYFAFARAWVQYLSEPMVTDLQSQISNPNLWT